MADTSAIDQLFLELSQFTKATTAKELALQKELGTIERDTQNTIADWLLIQQCTTVTVYDGVEQSMDTDDGRWQTVCKNHGAIACHKTLANAKAWLGQPEDWCEECRALLEVSDVAT